MSLEPVPQDTFAREEKLFPGSVPSRCYRSREEPLPHRLSRSMRLHPTQKWLSSSCTQGKSSSLSHENKSLSESPVRYARVVMKVCKLGPSTLQNNILGGRFNKPRELLRCLATGFTQPCLNENDVLNDNHYKYTLIKKQNSNHLVNFRMAVQTSWEGALNARV
jgi:hypothetical protein